MVLVAEDGSVENRLLDLPAGLPAGALVEAGNFLNARIQRQDLGDLKREVAKGREEMEQQLDTLTAKLVEAGLATTVGRRIPASSSSRPGEPSRRSEGGRGPRSHPSAVLPISKPRPT